MDSEDEDSDILTGYVCGLPFQSKEALHLHWDDHHEYDEEVEEEEDKSQGGEVRWV